MASSKELVAAVSPQRCITRDLFDSTIEVTVGPQKVLFNIHKGLLCNASSYFKAALQGGFQEAIEQKVSLPEDDPTMFKRFQLWLYSGSVIESPREASANVSWRDLFRLYIFGDTRGIPGLQNTAIDALIDKSQQDLKVPLLLYRYAYENTADSSPLRRLLVDWVVYCCVNPRAWYGFAEDCRDYYPVDCLIDIILTQADIAKNPALKVDDFTKIRTKYHVQITPDQQDEANGGVKRKLDEVV